MITTVLADDHPTVGQGLRPLLEGEDGCRVIGEADNGLAALKLITRLQPDIAVLTVQKPDLNGWEVARRVKAQSPRTRSIILSVYRDDFYVIEAFRNGAAAYVRKAASTTDLITAVHAVMAGRRYLSGALSELAIEAYLQRGEQVERLTDRYELLTDREGEVLQLAVQGMGNTEIGERLVICPRTAETHRTNLMRKLGIKTQTDLVRFAIARGLVPLNG